MTLWFRRAALGAFGRIGLTLAMCVALGAQPALASTLLFDDFLGSSLDLSLWNVLDAGGTIQVASNNLEMFGENASNHKRINSDLTFSPGAGAVVASALIDLDGRYQKFGFNVNALVGGYAFYFDTIAIGAPEQADPNTVRAIVYQGGPPVAVSVPVTWSGYHEFSVAWSQSLVQFFIEDSLVSQTSINYGTALPIGVWNDRPELMRTDWVKVESVPEPMTLSLVGLGLGAIGLRRRRTAR